MSPINTHDLHRLLNEHYTDNDRISIEWIEGLDPVLNLTLHDYGDMEVQIAASGQQIFASTILAPANQVKDRAGLNEACLRINPLNPLSNLGLSSQDGGKDVYIVFGELSSLSTIEQIDEEIQALAENTIAAAESLKPYFA